MEYLEKVKEKVMHTRILGIIGAILLAVGNFFPIVSMGSLSVSYIQGDGVFVFILAILAIIIIFSKELSKAAQFFGKLTNQKLTLISSLISTAILIYFTANFDDISRYTDKGIGFYILWIGAIALIVYPFLYKENK